MILGYTIANDVSVRDWQIRTPTMTMGKSFDTHGPLGPWIVTADELGDPHHLGLPTYVNDEVRQILTEHQDEMRRTGVSYQEMYKKVKGQLARDRKLVLR